MLGSLASEAFESACISAGSLHAHNRGMAWTKSLGYWPTEIINGLPVVPRWGLTGHVENTLLIAAYLGQAMVIRAHHQDFQGGMDRFNEIARFMSGLGMVRWSNMSDVTSQSYLWKVNGHTFTVDPFASRVTIDLPAEVRELAVAPQFGVKRGEWKVWDGLSSGRILSAGNVIPVQGGQRVCLELAESAHPSPGKGAMFNLRTPALYARRLLTEARDRIAPLRQSGPSHEA